MNMKPKLDMGLFVDLAEFTSFYQFLHDVIIKLFRRSKQNNFMSKPCKNHVKFWVNWIEFGVVSY